MLMKYKALIDYDLFDYYAFITGYGFKKDGINNVYALRYLFNGKDVVYISL